jgi:hypothetical protein
VDDHIEAAIDKGQGLGHVAFHKVDGIPFPISDLTVLLQLFLAEIKHRDLCAKRRQQGSLLPAARSKGKHVLACYITQPPGRHGTRWRQQQAVVARLRPDKVCVAHGDGPLPALSDPAGDSFLVVFDIVHGLPIPAS